MFPAYAVPLEKKGRQWAVRLGFFSPVIVSILQKEFSEKIFESLKKCLTSQESLDIVQHLDFIAEITGSALQYTRPDGASAVAAATSEWTAWTYSALQSVHTVHKVHFVH